MENHVNDIDKFIYSKKTYFDDPYFIKIIRKLIEENGLIYEVKSGTKFFRARPVFDEEKSMMCSGEGGNWGFDLSNSGATPSKKVKNEGRFHRVGESVLYVANDKYTALSEVRSIKGQWVSIAELQIACNSHIVDLCDKSNSIQDSLLHRIAFYLSLPNSLQGYHFSQQLGLCIKTMNYDGIKFNSSLSTSGENFIFFDINLATVNSSKGIKRSRF